jgi:hypothetical protein
VTSHKPVPVGQTDGHDVSLVHAQITRDNWCKARLTAAGQARRTLSNPLYLSARTWSRSVYLGNDYRYRNEAELETMNDLPPSWVTSAYNVNANHVFRNISVVYDCQN